MLETHETDHARTIGRFGIGYFGISHVPLGGGGSTGSATGAATGSLSGLGGMLSREGSTGVTTHQVGGTYWLSETMGINVALGLGMSSTDLLIDTDADIDDPVDPPSRFGLSFAAGVPFALAQARHFTFLVTPTLGAGYATGTDFGATEDDDVLHTGYFVDLGGTAGGEVQFGFIGVPQLAVRGSVGLSFRYSGGATNELVEKKEQVHKRSVVDLRTNVGQSPLDFFSGRVAVIYYL